MSLNYIISYLNRDLLYSKAVFRKIEEKSPCLSILHNLKEKKTSVYKGNKIFNEVEFNVSQQHANL